MLVMVSATVMAQEFFIEGAKIGLKDNSGRVIVQPIYDNVSGFAEGVVAVQRNNKWGYIDLAGRTILPFVYDYATCFNDGAAVVKLGEAWAIINRSGRETASL